MLNMPDRSLSSISDQVLTHLSSDNVNAALKAVFECVERVITEPICTAQVFGSRSLDNLCVEIGRKNLGSLARDNNGRVKECGASFRSVFIVTKLQKSGGHTKLVEDFIGAFPDSKHIILSTELIGGTDRQCLSDGIASEDNVIFEAAPKGNYHSKLIWLQSRLLEISAERVYLFNHHQDSVAVSAIQPQMEHEAYFYHHGDHHLCLGVFLPDLKHIDPHPMGYHNCRHELGIENIYIPLVVKDEGVRPQGRDFLSDGALVTCTVAKSNKIEPAYYVSYLEVIPLLLAKTGGKHFHIGRLSPWALFKIRRELKKNGVAPDRFVYQEWVPSVWKALLEHRVDLYLASFPYGAGLTLIEAMGSGTPVILHKHFYSDVLSSIDLAYKGVMNWASASELIEKCLSLTASELESHARLGRLQYESCNQYEYLHDAFAKGGAGLKPPEKPEEFRGNQDEWAVWLEWQVSMVHILKRSAYRLYRHMRAFWPIG